MRQLRIETFIKKQESMNRKPKMKLPKGIKAQAFSPEMYLNYEDMVDMTDSELLARAYYRLNKRLSSDTLYDGTSYDC